jgi:hypothetical protein
MREAVEVVIVAGPYSECVYLDPRGNEKFPDAQMQRLKGQGGRSAGAVCTDLNISANRELPAYATKKLEKVVQGAAAKPLLMSVTIPCAAWA